MSLRELWARQDRLQRTLVFKIAATVAILVIAIASIASYVIAVTAPGDDQPVARELVASDEGGDKGAARPEGAAPVPTPEGERSALDRAVKALADVQTAREDPLNVGVGIAALAAVALMITWLGLLLTYLELFGLAVLVAWPLSAIPATSEFAQVLVGMAALTAAFTALMEGIRSLFAWLPGPVFATARNVLVESVRMRISLVFIVLLILAMAALPNLLNESSPLRYRVQSFLQYGTSGAFWIIAVLTVLLSVATVAFEQRDRQIWQTMTKPVAAWQYVIGKWIGVVSIAGVLLLVSSTGVFLFTEYLRSQPAQGEVEAAVAGIASPSKDREILETQVLVARKSVRPDLPPELDINSEEHAERVRQYIENERQRDPQFARNDPALVEKIRSDLHRQLVDFYRAVGPGQSRQFQFSGLERAAAFNSPLFVRYRIDAGSNRPDVTYRLTFELSGLPPTVRETSLGHTHSIPLSPVVVFQMQAPDGSAAYATATMDDPQFHQAISAGLPPGTQLASASDVVAEDGTVLLTVLNGDIFTRTANPDTVSFPADGLELTYAVGSYRANFLRAVVVLWVKLCFLSMLGIMTATFLSFPVSSLVSFGAFLSAEAAGFLTQSLEYYSTVDREGNVQFLKVVIHGVASAVAWLFGTYSDLEPTSRLVDGRLLPWSEVGMAMVILFGATAVLYAVGVTIFRRRELAIYSGH